jgi:predicted metal-dependent hydrolase
MLADPILGDVKFRKNFRAKRYIIRISKGNVSVTVPFLGSYAKAEEFFHEKREVLIEKFNKQPRPELPSFNEQELRQKAKTELPPRLHQLAVNNGFTYREVKIRKSRTRWGSCSVKGVISLSIFLMLLPPHLIEYVLLHELCHTVHHNHGADFWELLNRLTEGKAKERRQELKKFRSF